MADPWFLDPARVSFPGSLLGSLLLLKTSYQTNPHCPRPFIHAPLCVGVCLLRSPRDFSDLVCHLCV